MYKTASLRIFLITFTFSALYSPLFSQETIDLNTAIERALEYSPALSIAEAEVEAKQATAYQMRLWPNPVASVTLDNAGNLSSQQHSGGQDITITISQLFELGGKRSARQREAALQMSLALWDREAVKLDLYTKVAKVVIDLAAAQEYAKNSQEQLATAQAVMEAISAKTDTGKTSPLNARKADVTFANAKLVADKADRTLNLSRKKLAAMWGSTSPEFAAVSFPFYEIDALPCFASLESMQLNNPDIARWDAEILAAQEALNIEKAQRVPDVVLTAGYVAGEGAGALVGVQMPIPIFDRNQGNICRAMQELFQATERQRESFAEVNIELTSIYDQLLSAYDQSLAYRDTVLPAAELAFNAARDAYAEGRQEYLDLLDAQRTLYDVQQQYIDALVEYHYKKEDAFRLVGQSF